MYFTLQMDGIQKQVQEYKRLSPQFQSHPVGQSVYLHIQQFENIISLMALLKNKAMRTRHWELLMEKIDKKLDTSSENFTLHDMIQIELHLHENEVRTIINSAVKELEIEESVNEIQNTWRSINLTFKKHPNEDDFRGFILDCADDVMQTFDGILMTLQIMATSQYVLYDWAMYSEKYSIF